MGTLPKDLEKYVVHATCRKDCEMKKSNDRPISKWANYQISNYQICLTFMNNFYMIKHIPISVSAAPPPPPPPPATNIQYQCGFC